MAPVVIIIIVIVIIVGVVVVVVVVVIAASALLLVPRFPTVFVKPIENAAMLVENCNADLPHRTGQ